jgi:regulatory protein
VIITTIKPQERSPLRENVYLDGKFGFGIASELRFDTKLKVGQSVSEEQIKELVFRDQVLKLLSSVQKFLAIRPRSEKEIKNNLKHKMDRGEFVNQEKIISAVLKKLSKYGLVNDLEFAKWWISQRQSGKPRGERMLRSELYSKGVSREIIDELFYKYETPPGEIDKIAVKKLSKYQNLPDQEFRAKISAYLARRGYDWDEISETVSRLLKERSSIQD